MKIFLCSPKKVKGKKSKIKDDLMMILNRLCWRTPVIIVSNIEKYFFSNRVSDTFTDS